MSASLTAAMRAGSIAVSLMSLLAAAQASACPVKASFTVSNNNVAPGTVVKLDGKASEPNGVKLDWEQTSGPRVTLTAGVGQDKDTVTFTAPSIPGSLGFSLTATANNCNPKTHSTSSTVNVVANNAPPVARATASPELANEGDTVVLDGSSSSDSDTGDTLTFTWTQIEGTEVSLATTSGHASRRSFVAPDVWPKDGETLKFQLAVSDGKATDNAMVAVTVGVVNRPPRAALRCTPDEVDERQLITLDASDSRDREDADLRYNWSQLLGPPEVPVYTATTPVVETVAPQLSRGEVGEVRFQVEVIDSGELKDIRQCTVFIRDRTPPVISNPESLTEEATSPRGAKVHFSVTAQDAVDDEQPYEIGESGCLAPSGSVFALGDDTVACAAMDSAGNVAEASFGVRVQDTTEPTFTQVPADITIEADNAEGMVHEFTASASDIVDESPVVECSPASKSVFSLGNAPDKGKTTTVTCTATDFSKNAGTARFNVTVQDTTPPTLTLPAAEIVQEATGPAGARVSFETSATDKVDGAVSVACNAPSGSNFALTTHEVSCSAADKRGNSASGKFSVTVRDTTKPTFTGVPADITIEADNPDGMVHEFTASASDIVDENPAVECSPASKSMFPLGNAPDKGKTTTVTCTATDFSSNAETASFNVTVQDTSPPVLTLPTEVLSVATGPNGATAEFTATARDAVDGSVVVSCRDDRAEVRSNDTTFPAGSTRVTCSASDSRGNKAEGSFDVRVNYRWTGFFRPIENWPSENVVKAGNAVPLKFSLNGNMGMGIMSPGFPKPATISCSSSGGEPVVETVTAGNSSLTYDEANGQYIYVWKTDKAWSGQCRVLQLKLADDQMYEARFRFTK